MQQNDIKDSLVKHIDEIERAPARNAAPGSAMMQVKSPYTTAVQVIHPRDLQKVERACLLEARIAGEEFYYSWKQGGKIIEGLSIGAALAIARNFGNNAVDTTVDDSNPDAYIFRATFIDLETGYNFTRSKRQSTASPKTKEGKDIYDGERGQDVVFEIGQSKAIRNAILNAIPNWLSKKVLEEAKKNVIKQITEKGIEKAKASVLQKIASLGVSLPRIESIYGNATAWQVDDVVRILSALRAIEDGTERAEELFPDKGKKIEAAPQPEKVEETKEPHKESHAEETEAERNFQTAFMALTNANHETELNDAWSTIEDLYDRKKLSMEHRENLLVRLKAKQKELKKR